MRIFLEGVSTLPATAGRHTRGGRNDALLAAAESAGSPPAKTSRRLPKLEGMCA